MSPDSPEENAREKIVYDLPLAITTISPQKKNADRFSLFHKKKFLIGVSGQTLLDHSIQKGTLLTLKLYDQLSYSEHYQAAKERAYRLLSGRDHGAEELRRKIIKRGIPDAIAEDIIVEFNRKGFLDDELYAVKFAKDKHHLKDWGPRKIKSALFKKGVSSQAIEKATLGLKDEMSPVKTCLNLVQKRRKHFLRESDLFKRKQKIFRYLAGKGYRTETIKKALPEIEKQLDA